MTTQRYPTEPPPSEPGSSLDQLRAADLAITALTVWREARAESYLGKLAVACCIVNRVDRPAWWGTNPWDVCTRRLQFSSLTDPRDPQLTKFPGRDESAWRECLQVGALALSRSVQHPAPGADSYYAITIPAPSWADDRCFVRQIGGHRFYDVDRDHEAAALEAA